MGIKINFNELLCNILESRFGEHNKLITAINIAVLVFLLLVLAVVS